MGFKDGDTYLPVPPPRLTQGVHPWPRGRAPVPYSRPPRVALQTRTARCKICNRRRPHTGLARGRLGLLNPDRTTTPGGGSQRG